MSDQAPTVSRILDLLSQAVQAARDAGPSPADRRDAALEVFAELSIREKVGFDFFLVRMGDELAEVSGPVEDRWVERVLRMAAAFDEWLVERACIIQAAETDWSDEENRQAAQEAARRDELAGPGVSFRPARQGRPGGNVTPLKARVRTLSQALVEADRANRRRGHSDGDPRAATHIVAYRGHRKVQVLSLEEAHRLVRGAIGLE